MSPLKKYIWLVDAIMRGGELGLTIEQIGNKWDADDEMRSNGAFSKRSFYRHRNEIEELFGITIESHSIGQEFRYRIADNGKSDYFRHWLLNSISVNRIVTDSQQVAQYIDIPRANANTPLPLLLEALKNQRMVSFTYGSYWMKEPVLFYNFMPHALKMFERRWYLIGRYNDNKPYRCFALDRMSHCELQEETYQRDPAFDIEQMYDGVYGVTIDEETPVESVWIKATPLQANYLRSPRLHESQMEIGEKEGCPIFALRVRPNIDFRQKLLSLGSTIEVLKPESLRQTLREEVQKMSQLYEEE